MAEPVIAPPTPTPAAASPAPAAPASTSAPVATPAATPVPASTEPNADFDAWEKLAKADNTPPTTKGKETPTAKKPDAANPPAAKPSSPPAPAAVLDPKKVGATGELNWNSAPKALRERKEQLEKELSEASTAKLSLETKLKEFESKGKDTEGLLAQIDVERKEKEALMADLRALRQETTPEFKEKYDKPFNRQAEFSKTRLNGLTKSDQTPFTWDGDFATLYQLPYNKAYATAREMLGEDAPIVMEQIRDLQKIDFERQQALGEEKTKWKERTNQDAAKSAETKAREEKAKVEGQQKVRDLWKQVNTDYEASVDTYRVDPADKELVDARAKDLAILDADYGKDFQGGMKRNAHARLRAAMFSVNQAQIARLTKKNQELEAKVAALDPAPPDPGSRSGQDAPNGGKDLSWEEAARKTLL